MIIKYTFEDGSTKTGIPMPEMFNPNSDTRQMLRTHGVDFSDKDGNDATIEIMEWIARKDCPEGTTWEICLDN